MSCVDASNFKRDSEEISIELSEYQSLAKESQGNWRMNAIC